MVSQCNGPQICIRSQTSSYLVGDFDEQVKHEDNEHVVKQSNSSDQDIDNFERNITDMAVIQSQIVIRGDVSHIARQRCVLHRY